MHEEFSRTELLLGPAAMEKLAASHVAVFGVGGVGGYAAEALARCGVGSIELVDDDKIGITNINRQIIALRSTLGRYKADVMAERIADINPACRVNAVRCFFLPETSGRFDFARFDYVIDAVDTVTAKLQLIEKAHESSTPIISSMGAAKKLDPTAFEVADIYDTSICPLARIIRKECRKRGIGHLKVVYSKEEPCNRFGSIPEGQLAEEAGKLDDGGHRIGRAGIPPSIAFVPSVVGLIMAAEVVKDLVRDA